VLPFPIRYRASLSPLFSRYDHLVDPNSSQVCEPTETLPQLKQTFSPPSPIQKLVALGHSCIFLFLPDRVMCQKTSVAHQGSHSLSSSRHFLSTSTFKVIVYFYLSPFLSGSLQICQNSQGSSPWLVSTVGIPVFTQIKLYS